MELQVSGPIITCFWNLAFPQNHKPRRGGEKKGSNLYIGLVKTKEKNRPKSWLFSSP
jgi:hypothetical protein